MHQRGFRIVPVADLPGFHNPFRCALRSMFDEALREAEAARARQIAERGTPARPTRVRRWRQKHDEAELALATAQRERAVEAMTQQILAEQRRAGALLSVEEQQQIMVQVRARIDGEEAALCPYHAPDWRIVAQRACSVIDAHRADVRIEHVEGHYEGLAEQERRALFSLFDDPIAWWPGETQLTNGQHRVCGLTVARALRVPVTPSNAEVESQT